MEFSITLKDLKVALDFFTLKSEKKRIKIIDFVVEDNKVFIKKREKLPFALFSRYRLEFAWNCLPGKGSIELTKLTNLLKLVSKEKIVNIKIVDNEFSIIGEKGTYSAKLVETDGETFENFEGVEDLGESLSFSLTQKQIREKIEVAFSFLSLGNYDHFVENILFEISETDFTIVGTDKCSLDKYTFKHYQVFDKSFFKDGIIKLLIPYNVIETMIKIDGDINVDIFKSLDNVNYSNKFRYIKINNDKVLINSCLELRFEPFPYGQFFPKETNIGFDTVNLTLNVPEFKESLAKLTSKNYDASLKFENDSVEIKRIDESVNITEKLVIKGNFKEEVTFKVTKKIITFLNSLKTENVNFQIKLVGYGFGQYFLSFEDCERTILHMIRRIEETVEKEND